MNWRSKARLAKAISKLPSGMSYGAYYLMQRHFGALRSAYPDYHFKAAVAIADFIRNHRGDLTGTETFLEIGTGRRLTLPIALWLCGAGPIITTDLNPYLKPELVFEDLGYIRKRQGEIERLFPRPGSKHFQERFQMLLSFRGDLTALLKLLNTRYISGANVASLDLPAQSVDYHVSYGVIEHIARELLDGILLEAKRLLRPSGLAIHYSTLADLFSGVDDSISPVNFLQFSEDEWDSIAGNRYMYHNRLRVDELRQVFERAGFRVVQLDADVHPESLRVIKTGVLALDRRFRDKSPETNAAQNAWVAAAPCEGRG